MPDMFELDAFHSGQVRNFYLLALGQVLARTSIRYYEGKYNSVHT